MKQVPRLAGIPIFGPMIILRFYESPTCVGIVEVDISRAFLRNPMLIIENNIARKAFGFKSGT